MKVVCPACETTYNVPEDKITSAIAKSACKKCGVTLLIDKETGKVRAEEVSRKPGMESGFSSTPPRDSLPSVLSMSSKDQGGRDYLAVGVLIAALIFLMISGYFLVKNINTDLFYKPSRSFSQLYRDVGRLIDGQVTKTRKESRVETRQTRQARKQLTLGHRFFEKKNLPEALRAYDEAIQIQPNNPEVYFWRGRLFVSKGDMEKAASDFRRAVALNPSYVEAYDNLGWLFSQTGNFDESIRYLTRSIELRPDNGWAYYQRGHCYHKKGDMESALKDAKKACRLGYKDGCKVYEKFKK